jgi:transcriptional regulator with XRE-family HTH domain
MPFEGRKLREWRFRRALTLRDLSARSGVAYATIHALETGKQHPRPSTLRRLAEALQLPPDVFFADEEETGKAAA